MFETIRDESAGARFRRAALAPGGAFFLTHVYFGLYPLTGVFGPSLFHAVVVIVFVGTVVGAIALWRAVTKGQIRGVTVGWVAFAAAVELLTARLLASLTVPWL